MDILTELSIGARQVGKRVAIVLFVVVLALLPMMQCGIARREAFAANLRADSAVAAADTTRVLQLKLAQLGDSLRVMERRVVQHAPTTDALSRALKLQPTAQVEVSASIASLSERVKSDTVWMTRSDSVRAARFDVRQPPFTARAEVELPPAPLAGTLSLNVEVDTAQLSLRLGCGPPAGSGVRSASVAVVAPKWLSVKITDAEQSPDVCSPQSAVKPAPVGGLLGSLTRRIGVSVGYALVPAGYGAPASGLALMLGVKVWP